MTPMEKYLLMLSDYQAYCLLYGSQQVLVAPPDNEPEGETTDIEQPKLESPYPDQ